MYGIVGCVGNVDAVDASLGAPARNLAKRVTVG
jgi:hypothetical protein